MKRRPSAKQLLQCDLLPRKVELEEKYLNEVLQTLSNPHQQSKLQSYQQILSKLFDFPTPASVLTTYDREVSINANKIDADAFNILAKSLNDVKGAHWTAHNMSSFNPMSSTAVVAAISSLMRAQHVGSVSGGGKEGEALRGAPQHIATILAMTAASAAAIDGSCGGVIGADPRLVETLCCKLRDIFQSHGAVCLQGPLLRPRDSNDCMMQKPVEVLSRRGIPLNLREDLTINFARAVSRGGSGTSNLKRFDIDKVFIESDAGLHPKELLEASFDIIQDENKAKPEFLEAEAIFVLCQVVSLLSPKEEKTWDFPPIVLKSPIWYLRLTNTRLSDALLDLMLIPTTSDIRVCCLNMFTNLTACPPTELCNHRHITGKNKRKFREAKAQRLEFQERCIESAVINDNLPKHAAKRLRAFFSSFLIPHLDANKVLDTIYEATKKLHHADVNSSNYSDDIKRLSKNCFNEVIRCIGQLKQLLKAIEALGIVSAAKINKKDHIYIGQSKNLSYPAYITIDLGLRQKRQHYSGALYFQAILLQDNFATDDGKSNNRIVFGGKGTRLAEGGRYDDLTRQFRPPGNFGTVKVNDYTAAKVPFCVGTLFFITRMIDRIYSDAAKTEKWQGQSYIESLRATIGHPLLDSLIPIHCIVTSESGLDNLIEERAQVASCLWAAGISCEYLAQSGMTLSLLRHCWNDSNPSHEWSSSVDKICGICAILNIPFVIIVQPHLLKSKMAVKLRQTTAITTSGPVLRGSEELVTISSLPSLLLDRLSSISDVDDDTLPADLPSQPTLRDSLNVPVQSCNNIDIECIYVGTDQYFDYEHRVNNAQYKHIQKIMRSSTQKMSCHISTLETAPVFAIDLPFRIVRDIGSSLIFDGLQSLSNEVTMNYPHHKKLLRNLMYALDAFIRKDQSQSNSCCEKQIFLYSVPCDKYDLISLKL